MRVFDKIVKYKHELVLFLIIALGSFLRIYDIARQSLWIDEGYTMMQEKSIYLHHYPLLMSGNIEYKDLLLPYLLVFLRFFTGENILAFRLISALFGIAAILAIYFLGKAYFNKTIGLVSAFLLSFSYWHIAWSRQIRSYSLFVFLFLLSLLFFFYLEKSNNKKYLWLLLLSLFLALLAKLSLGIILSILILTFLLFQKKHFSYWQIRVSIIPILLAIGLNHRFLTKIISFLNANYLKYYTVDYFWNYFGLFFVLAVVGAYLTFKKTWSKLNISIFIMTLLFFSFFSLINQRRYLFFLTPLIFIYASYCAFLLAKGRIKIMLGIIALLVFIDQASWKSLTFIPSAEYFLEEYTPQPDFSAAYEHISQMKDEPKIISAYPFIDYIYTDKIGYALPISYSGLSNDSALTFSTEYYTNAKRLFSAEELSNVSKESTSLIILDDMAISRSDKNMIKYIKENGILIFEEKNKIGQNIFIYKLSN